MGDWIHQRNTKSYIGLIKMLPHLGFIAFHLPLFAEAASDWDLIVAEFAGLTQGDSDQQLNRISQRNGSMWCPQWFLPLSPYSLSYLPYCIVSRMMAKLWVCFAALISFSLIQCYPYRLPIYERFCYCYASPTSYIIVWICLNLYYFH